MDPATMHAPHSLLVNGVDLVKLGIYWTMKNWKAPKGGKPEVPVDLREDSFKDVDFSLPNL